MRERFWDSLGFFCIAVYDVALWKTFSVVVFKSSDLVISNISIKKLFGFQRRDSMSGILMDLLLPTVDTVVHNSCVLFTQLCSVSCNKIVLWLATIGVC